MRNKNFKAQIRALCVYITTIIARILSRVKSVIFNREFYPEIQNKITHDLSAFLNFAKALYYWLHEYFTSDNFKNILFAFQTDLNRLLSKLAYHTFPLLGKIQRRKRKTKLFIVKKIRKVNGILRQFFEDLEAIPSNPERAKKLRRSKRGRRILKIIKIYYGIFHNPVLIKIWATRVVVNHKLKGGFGLSKAIFSKSLKLSKKFMYGLPHFFMNVWISFRSLTPKHYIFIVAFLLGALFMQTQMHKSKILIERSTQPSFVSVSANSSADLEFEFDYYNSERTLFWKRFVKPVLPVGDTEPKLLLQDFKGNDVKFGYEVTRVGESKFQVTVTPSGSITPGEYTAKLEVYKDGVYYLQQQRFAYGVLAINTNKATYIVGEEAYLQMAALRNDGHTVCDAELDLQIIDPNGTEIGLAVEPSGKCDRNNVTDVPDYESFMNLEVEGVYQMRLTNKINKYSIQDSFHVTDSLPYEVERIGPTRIYPFVPYDNKIIIKANEDFKGEITEIVPKSFEINRETVEVNDSKLITWEVDMLAGDVQEFEYEFDAPDVSPELYLIGPLIVGNFEEARQWQIAGDSEETEIFTTPGSTNWTVPEFVTLITVESWGAGGGGKGGGSVLPGGGGGGGAYSKRVVPVTPSTTITVVVGSGGSGGTQNGGNGGNGGSSYVSNEISGTTANGGSGATTTSGGSLGGANINSDEFYTGGAGGAGHMNSVMYVGADSANTTTVSIPTHQIGDLILIMAFRDGSTTPPTVPSGWTEIGRSAANTNSSIMAFMLASTTSETSGTWTNATELAVQVFRGHAGIGVYGGNDGSSTTMNYPAVSMVVTDGTSWMAGFGAHRTASNVEQAPTGMTNRTSSGTEIAAHNTNGGVSSWSSQNVTVNANSGWRTWLVEIVAATTTTSLQYVSGASGVSSISSMPTHRAGDLMVMFAYRDGNINPPSVLAGWSTWSAAAGANSNGSVGAYRIAQSASETSGTWNNGTTLILHVYRFHGGIGASADTGGVSTTVTYPGLSMVNTSGTSWVAGFAGHRSTNTSLENPPSGMVNRVNDVDATDEGSGHDTDGGVSSWSNTNVSVGGSNSGYRAKTLEILSAVQRFGGGSGGSSAGISANGNIGNTNSGDTGGAGVSAPTGGGNGGAGGDVAASGSAGSNPGGGGGGGGNYATTGNAGGAGAHGKVVISYTIPDFISISGTCKQADKTTNCTDVGTIKYAINDTIQAETQETVAGTWTISGIIEPSNGDIITVFIDGAGEADEAVGVTKYDGDGDITGIELIAQSLSIGSDDNATITNDDLAQFDNSVSGDEDIFHEVDSSNNLVINDSGKSSASIFIKENNTFRPDSTNSGNVTTKNLYINDGASFTADGNTITLTGGDTPLFFVYPGSSVNFGTSTFVYNSNENVSLRNQFQYYNLILAPTSSGTPTYTISSPTFPLRVNNFTIGDGTNPVTFDWSSINASIEVKGNLTLLANTTWIKSDTASLTFNGTTTPVSLTDNNSTKQDLGAVVIDGSKEVDLGSSVTVTRMNVTSDDTLDLQSSGYTLKITGSGTGVSRPFINNGTLSIGTNSIIEYVGTTETEVQAGSYSHLTLNQSGTTFITSGNLTIFVSLTIQAGTFNAGSGLILLQGTTNPLVINGTLEASTSTFRYHNYANISVLAVDYYNLEVGTFIGLANHTYTVTSGTLNVLNNLTIGSTVISTITLDVNTNDPEVIVGGDFLIQQYGAYSASSNEAYPLRVVGNLSNNGTFTHNSGKVILNGAIDSFQSILGSSTINFYSLEIETGDREIVFGTSNIKEIDTGGSLVFTGTNCENMTRVRSTTSGVQATLEVDISATATVSHLDLQDLNLTGKAITAANSVDSGNNSGYWTIDPNACIGTSTNQATTGYAFQRKVIYDDVNNIYWSFNHDGDEIEIKYSDDEGAVWNNPATPSSARLPYNTNDFSVWWGDIDETQYIVLAVSDGGDIKVRQGVLSETDISWDTDVSVVLDETDNYSKPYITFDSSNKMWVGATYNDDSDYVFKTVVSDQSVNTDVSTWTWTTTPYQLSDDQTSSNVYGTLSSLSDDDMYATFVVDTELLGCRWVDIDSTWVDTSGDPCISISGDDNNENTYFDSLNEGLIGYWKMNEASWNGTTDEVIDSSEMENHGTRGGNATTVSSGFGRSGTFDQFDDYVNIPDNSSLDITEDFSISAWINPQGGSTRSIVSKRQAAGGSGYALVLGGSNEIYCQTENAGFQSSYTATSAAPNDVWTHVVIARSGTSCHVYINGVDATSSAASHSDPFTNNFDLRIGTATDTSEDYNGKVDEVRLYNRAISTEEISKILEYVPESVNIDDASDFDTLLGAGRQMVRTKAGVLYTFLNNGGSCELWKSSDGVSWSEVDSANNPACMVDMPVSLAIDSSDVLHVVYTVHNFGSQEIWYNTVTSDTFGTPAEIGSSDLYTITGSLDIALDSNNVPHVVYLHNDVVFSTYVYYNNRIGGSWNANSTAVETVTGAGTVYSTSITINENNIPEIAYINSADNDLTAAVGDDNDPDTTGQWTLQDVDTDINDTDDQRGASIAVNTITGDTWIAYVDSDSTIAIAKHTGSDWSTNWTTVTSKTDVGYEPSIAIAGNSDVYVFYENDTDDIAYDIFNGSSWAGEVVLHEGTFQNVKAKWSFEWNNYGPNKIDYLYSDGTDVYYDQLFLRRSPTKIDDASDFGALEGSSKQIIRNSYGDLYSITLDNTDVLEVWKSIDGFNWIEQDISDKPTGLVANSQIALAIDSNEILHIAYQKGYSIYHQTFDTISGQFGTEGEVRTGNINRIDSNPELAIDSNDKPHVSFTEFDGSSEYLSLYSNKISGSWKTPVAFGGASGASNRKNSFSLNGDDIPVMSQISSSNTNLFASIGNSNNASSFTNQLIDSTTSGALASSIGIDSSGNTWIVYVDENGTKDFISLIKHNVGDSWSTWQTVITNSNAGYEPSLSIEGTSIYVFYENDQNDIAYDVYNGTSWRGETVLEMHGELQDVKARWSYINNYDSTGRAALQTNTYYFDNSDNCAAGASCQDPNSVWSNDANAFDGSITTAATTTSVGSTSSNYLRADGTNAPGNGGDIVSVKARIYGYTEVMGDDIEANLYYSEGNYGMFFTQRTTPGWNNYTLLFTPSGGWTWEILQSLSIRIYNVLNSTNTHYVYKVELLVESSNSDAQREIDYVYSDGTDVYYNRLYLGETIFENFVPGVKDVIATGLSTGFDKNLSTVSHKISTVDYIHLAYVDSTGNIYYDRYDGDWEHTNVQVNDYTDNQFLGLSIDSSTNDLYLGFSRSGNDDFNLQIAEYSSGPSWNWGSSTTLLDVVDEVYTNYSPNFSGPGTIGGLLSLGDLSPYNIYWEQILAGVANTAPTVTNVIVNGGDDIQLAENTTTNISWTASVTDAEGYEQISLVKGKLYRSSVSGAETCTNNNNNCYEDTNCNLSGCSGTTCTATCTVAMYFHTDATDANSDQPTEYWRGWVHATDTLDDVGFSFSDVDAVDVESLSALSISESIDYGFLIPGDNSTLQSTLVTNTGNVTIDTELSGDDLCIDYPTCASYFISVEKQEYDTLSFDYGDGTPLTLLDERLQFNLVKSTTSPSNSYNNIYWRLGLPIEQQLGEYAGQNYIFAVNDNL